MTLEEFVRCENAKWLLDKPATLWRSKRQAKLWIDMIAEAVPEASHYGGEREAVVQHSKTMALKAISELGSPGFNIIDLGCGDGSKGIEFAAAFRAKGGNISYVPEDHNAAFIGYATRLAMSKELHVQNTAPKDFFKTNFSSYRTQSRPSNIYLLLGNINYSFDRLLAFMRRAITPKDAFIIGTELFPGNVGAMLEHYRADKQLERWFFETLRNLGFARKQAVFDPVFNFANCTVEYAYELLSVPTMLQRKGVKAGDRIVLAESLRPTTEQLSSWFRQHFTTALYVNEKGTAALAYCSTKTADSLS